MAVTSGTQTVGTTRVQIDGMSVQHSHIEIRNNDTTKTLYVGGPDLTVDNGLPVDKLATMHFDLPPNTPVYMIADSGTVSVSYMRVTH
jgi:hypothetical protein